MIKVLANDGISASGKALLEEKGFEVIMTKVAQEQLHHFINENDIVVLLVRSATQVDKKIIHECPGLKLIGRGGVGLDNIDLKAALAKDIKVIYTPEAPSESVAELVFGHLLNGVRFLHQANREMPLEGDSRFKDLKKTFSAGRELKGKTLGIIGFGRIGRETAKRALAFGMEVSYHDNHTEKAELELSFFNGQSVTIGLENQPMETVLKKADFISLHVPMQDNYLIGEAELQLVKKGCGIINTSRGGVIDEVALIKALNNDTLAFAGLDVFESEPKPEIQLLMHPKISLSPHIGASTIEAQDKIGVSLATQVIEALQ